MRWIFLVFLTGVLQGCGWPFAPATLVERLRILGIRAEPPETDPFGEVALSALVVDPAGEGRPLRCVWAVCLFDLGYTASDIPCPGPGSYPLEGTETSTVLRMPDLVAWLAEQGFDLGQLPEGVELEDLPLVIGLEVEASPERARAIKRIKLTWTVVETSNRNPVLLGLTLDEVPVGDEPLALAAGTKVTLAPLVDEGSRQTYRREGEEADRLEDFLFSWFSTAGEFSDRRTILDVDAAGKRLDTNQWKLPAEPGSATLWLVVRDERYGEDWLERRFEVVPEE